MSDYLAILQHDKKISIDHERLVDAINQANYRILDYSNIVSMNLKIASKGDFRTTSTDDLIEFLLEQGISQKKFEVKGRKNLSFDMEKVVKPLIAARVFPEILEPYVTMRSYVSYRNFLNKQLLGNFSVKYSRRNDGVFLRQYDFTVTERENLRVYYSDIAVINIPKIYSNIITVPDTDYFLVWCDYPQADWRMAYNLFLRDDTNAKIMDTYDDSYQGAAILVEGDEFIEEDFQSKRKSYKVDTLKTFYNSRDNSPLVQKLRTFFMSCPKYRKYYNDLAALYSLKIPIPCESYFGFQQMLPEGSYKDAFISKGLNTPTQTMTSHLVMETVFGVISKFLDLGYTSEDILPYFIRHDEPLFLAHKRILQDAWVFGDCSQIHIDGFSPIKLDFHFGYNYLEEDNEITLHVKKSCIENQSKFQIYEKGSLNAKWNPIPSVISGYVDVLIRNDITYTSFYIESDDICEFYPVSTKIFKDAVTLGIQQLLDRYKGTKYLILKNISISNIYKEGDCLVSLDKTYSPDLIEVLQDSLELYLGGCDHDKAGRTFRPSIPEEGR